MRYLLHNITAFNQTYPSTSLQIQNILSFLGRPPPPPCKGQEGRPPRPPSPGDGRPPRPGDGRPDGPPPPPQTPPMCQSKQ